jgi:UDP-N-acetylmuramate--alanine ligase
MAASVQLQVPGEHNVLNALAALAVADLLALPLDEAAAALGEYRGTGRRFELRGEVEGVTIIDDYAHHPTEIRATLAAARARFPGREVWAVWQPHTYSRTQTLFGDFLVAFGDADHLLVTEVYAAREAPPAGGFSALQFVQAILTQGDPASPESFFMPDLGAAEDFLLERLQTGDVVLVLSAGDAYQISEGLLQALPARKISLPRNE